MLNRTRIPYEPWYEFCYESWGTLMRFFCAVALGVLFCVPGSGKAVAQDDFILSYVPGAQVVGQGHLSVFIWEVYDSTLYAPQGQWNPERPYALELSYLRFLYGAKIAERSVKEIRGLGFKDEGRLAEWGERMGAFFPDVHEGDSLTGVYTQDKRTVFFLNGREIGAVDDPQFGEWFFGIWLNPNTSQPGLRRKLLGEG